VSRTDRPEIGLLDTNVVILLDQIQDATSLPRRPAISTIVLAELSVGPLTATDPGEAARRQQRLQETEAAFDPIPFDASAARAYGVVSASLRRAGRKTGARAFDALLAATALDRGLPLYTTNPDDFAGIDGLDVRVVPHPDRPATA
jgi:predicted nucleic acid-binding protein